MKSKVKSLTAAEVAALVDELGSIDMRLAAVSFDKDRREVITPQLRAYVVDTAPDAAVSIAGAVFAAALTACPNEKLIDNARLYRAIGPKAFLAIATVAQKNLPKSLTPAQLKSIVTEARTGTRRVTTAMKLAVMEKAA